MSLESVTYVASGNVAPMRFVGLVSGSDYKVFQATGSTIALAGISGMDVQSFDATNHATDGKTCRVYGVGEVALLELGGTVSAGNYLTSDSNGKGVAVSTTATARGEVGGFALRSGQSGEYIQAVVIKFAGPQSN